jgi:hypothetical protein
MNKINVLENMGKGSQGKIRSFVNRTKCAVIPGAVPGEPQKQASRFAWRSDGALFKSVV